VSIALRDAADEGDRKREPVAAETKLWKARPAICVGGREGKEGDGHDRE
jgi:hypothetical protein